MYEEKLRSFEIMYEKSTCLISLDRLQCSPLFEILAFRLRISQARWSLELCEDEHDWFNGFIVTQPVVIQMRQVYFWYICISRSYCSKMLVFIKAFRNVFFRIEWNTPVSVSTVWRTCLTQNRLTSQLSKSNKHGENI